MLLKSFFGKEARGINKDTISNLASMGFVNAGIELSIHTLHDCRHTSASFLDTAGANEKAIKLILDHSTGQDVTNRVYIHKDIEELRKAINMAP